jgi:5-methylcytosine-specific restriction endonuclease McrA
MENRNAYYRDYMAKRRRRRRELAVEVLGGKCARCGNTEGLEADHVDPKKKSFGLSGCDLSEQRFLEELEKCQLLCDACHNAKTIVEKGKKQAPGTHGTLSSYRYCHCEECRRAKREWFRAYRAKKNQQAT